MTPSGRELCIRPAGSTDFAGYRELLRHLITDDRPASEELQRHTFDAMLCHPGLTILLAVVDGAPVSTCTLAVIPNLTRGCNSYALIENVVTHRDWRGRGIGRRLMRTAVDTAFAEGCFKVMLMSGATNNVAHRFYDELGFSRTKTAFELRAPGYPPRR